MTKVINNSGGRSSGMMTYMVKDQLGPDDRIVFANTGRERPETLEFLRSQELHWGIDIVWLEYDPDIKFRIVDYYTASRDGEPFKSLIAKRKYLPNAVTRFCTGDLKIKVVDAYIKSLGITDYTHHIGIRYDEPRRTRHEEKEYPLYDERITGADVARFWDTQPFNLILKAHEGNCDLCFMKGVHKRLAILADRPDLAIWWIQQERSVGATFQKDVSVATLLAKAKQPQLAFEAVNESLTCHCTD